MTGIIGAMQIEIDGLLQKLENRTDTTKGLLLFSRGTLNNKEVVVCRCGIGKVNAATATAVMLQSFEIDEVINIGVAGGIMSNIRQGDIVIASKAVQHDFDATADGITKKGQVAGFGFVEFVCDKAAVKRMQEVLSKKDYTFYTGAIASGDQFINDKAKSVSLNKEFNALACDMETAAIAHTCHILGARFLAMRAISDNADGSAAEAFLSFVEKAAKKSIAAIVEYIAAVN